MFTTLFATDCILYLSELSKSFANRSVALWYFIIFLDTYSNCEVSKPLDGLCNKVVVQVTRFGIVCACTFQALYPKSFIIPVIVLDLDLNRVECSLEVNKGQYRCGLISSVLYLISLIWYVPFFIN